MAISHGLFGPDSRCVRPLTGLARPSIRGFRSRDVWTTLADDGSGLGHRSMCSGEGTIPFRIGVVLVRVRHPKTAIRAAGVHTRRILRPDRENPFGDRGMPDKQAMAHSLLAQALRKQGVFKRIREPERLREKVEEVRAIRCPH